MSHFSYLATPSATREILNAYDLAAKKSLGQNFLVNDAIVGKILHLAEVSSEDTILEIGPGIGTLTAGLLNTGAKVIAIERDSSLPIVLEVTLRDWQQNFELLEKDALHVSETDLGKAARQLAAKGAHPDNEARFPHKLVANLPYNIAATVVLDYFQKFPFIESATVMVQREVAERMKAEVGTKNYGAYTVKLSLYAEPADSFNVSPSNFNPAPRVESAVIRLNRRIGGEGEQLSEGVLRAAAEMTDAAFHARRKTIFNSMRNYFKGKLDEEQIAEILNCSGIDKKRRAETLTREEFIRLGKCYSEAFNPGTMLAFKQ